MRGADSATGGSRRVLFDARRMGPVRVGVRGSNQHEITILFDMADATPKIA
jgi:hypothetical protein